MQLYLRCRQAGRYLHLIIIRWEFHCHWLVLPFLTIWNITLMLMMMIVTIVQHRWEYYNLQPSPRTCPSLSSETLPDCDEPAIKMDGWVDGWGAAAAAAPGENGNCCRRGDAPLPSLSAVSLCPIPSPIHIQAAMAFPIFAQVSPVGGWWWSKWGGERIKSWAG